MEKIMVIVFDEEAKAHQGIRALRKLHDEKSISIEAAALIRKDQEGKISILDDAWEDIPFGTLGGSAIGALIGAVAGPVGVLAGTAMGSVAGLGADLLAASIDDDLVNEVSQRLERGKCAVLLDVEEEWVTPVDQEMERYTKVIFRRPKIDVEDEIINKSLEAYQLELDNLDKELKDASSERKAKLQAKIDDIKKRKQSQVQDFKKRGLERRKNWNSKIAQTLRKAAGRFEGRVQ